MHKQETLNHNAFISKQFVTFAVLVFLLAFGDSVVSYVVPLFLENAVNNAFIVGLIFSFSSLVGLLVDFTTGHVLKKKGHRFFISSSIILCLSLPIVLIFFPQHIVTYLIAMAIWGVYYEFEAFGKFNYVKTSLPMSKYTDAWGMFAVLGAIAYLTGPAITTFLISKSLNSALYFAFWVFLSTGIIYLVFNKKQTSKYSSISEDTEAKTTIKEEFAVWRILFKKVWFVWLFSFALVSLDAVFWSIGIIFAESLREQSSIEWMFLWAYMLPSTVIGLLVHKISGTLGKKKTAFIATLFASIGYIFTGLIKDTSGLVVFMFIASCFSAVAYPAIAATFEDYIERLKDRGMTMIGIGQTSGSLAYIVSPILYGGLAEIYGIQAIFAIQGGVMLVLAIIGILIVPKKIKMPQKELLEIEAN